MKSSIDSLIIEFREPICRWQLFGFCAPRIAADWTARKGAAMGAVSSGGVETTVDSATVAGKRVLLGCGEGPWQSVWCPCEEYSVSFSWRGAC